jgi:uncharacterized protein
MSDQEGPVRGASRIEVFDVLRGAAMLGILAVNMWSFAMPPATYMNPSAYGSLDGLNGLSWLIVHVFFDSKFISIFSILFGAGLVVMGTRAREAGKSPWLRHFRRTMALLLIGLAHSYLLWWGDILVSYAICGFLVFTMVRTRPWIQLAVGFLLFSMSPLLYLAGYFGMSQMDPAGLDRSSWSPTEEQIEQDIESMQGDWTEQMEMRVQESLSVQTEGLFFYLFWRISGLMLVGMALYQWGILGGERRASFYRNLALICLPLGLALIGMGVWKNISTGFQYLPSFFLYSQFNYWGSLLVCLGYIGLIALMVKASAWSALRNRLAAVGRLALTCYLGQTLIATTIFFGHGLGLYGQVPRAGQFGIFLAVSVFQLWLAPLWLKHFRQGPLEWLLRGAVYGSLPPLRRIRLSSHPKSKG